MNKKIFLLLSSGMVFLFAMKPKNVKVDINESLIKKIVNKKTLEEIEISEKKAENILKSLKPISYAGFRFYSPAAKQMVKQIDKKFKMCLKDKKYRTNTGFCYDVRFRNLQRLKEFDDKQTYFLGNQIYNLRKQRQVILNSIIMDTPQYKEYRKIKLQCMKYANVNKVRNCYKKYAKKLHKLNTEISIIKEKIVNKLKKMEKNLKNSKKNKKKPQKKSQNKKKNVNIKYKK